MSLVVRGTHNGREYDLAYADTEIEAGNVKRREERNGHYSDIEIVDLDEFEESEFRKLPRHELEAAARNGHPVAARLLGIQAAGPEQPKEPTDDELDAELARLSALRDSRRKPDPAAGSSPFGDDQGEQGDDEQKSSTSTRGKRGKVSE